MEHSSSSIPTTQKNAVRRGKNTAARQEAQAQDSSSPQPSLEQITPLMLRLKHSQRVCAERIAEQLDARRSQLDPTFYQTGVLLCGVERLGKAEMIGNLTRKEVAAFLKSAFTPLFELLYEQDELPLVFSLLIGRETPSALSPSPVGNGQHPASRATGLSIQTESSGPEQPRIIEEDIPLLSEDAEAGLEGFPGGI